MYWEFLATDIEGVESVGAGGAVFEEVFFRFGEFLARLVLAEAVAPSAHSCRLDARIRPGLLLRLKRDIRRCLPAKPLTDELVLLVKTHWVA